MGSEPERSLAKAVSYRITSAGLTALIVLIITRDNTLAVQVGGADFFLKTAWYYLHERAWNQFRWGKY